MGQCRGRWGELAGELGFEAAFAGLVSGAGVIGDQVAQPWVRVLDVAQVPGAVKGVEAGVGDIGGVADVVQPGGSVDEFGVLAQYGGQVVRGGGDALGVCPAARQRLREQRLGELTRPPGVTHVRNATRDRSRPVAI